MILPNPQGKEQQSYRRIKYDETLHVAWTVWLAMNVNKVSAFQNKRGLLRVSGAGPQVVGLTPQTTDD